MERKIKFTVILSTIFMITNTQALVITTEHGMGADTYVANDYQSGPDLNFGTEILMRACRQLANTRCKIGYLRFDLSGVEEITTVSAGAYLTIDAYYLKGGQKIVEVYGLLDSDDDFWIESGVGGITYNTAPGLIPNPPTTLGNYALDPAKVILLGTLTTPAAPDYYLYPITFSSNPEDLPLENFLNADTNRLVTFFFIGTNNETEFATKEHTLFNSPALVLIPEPATLALLGLGSLITLRRRHR